MVRLTMANLEKISVSDFKARALGIFENVSKSGKSVTVTKHGKVLAQVVPCCASQGNPVPDKLAGTVLHEGDIASPLGAKMWNAAKS